MAKAEYRNSLRSKRLIQEALAQLLLEKSLEKITVTDIVDKAGINRGTFYAHYSDIPDMLHHLMQQTFSMIHSSAELNPSSPEETAHRFLYSLQRVLEKDLFFYRKIMNSPSASVLQEQLVGAVVEYFLSHKDAYFEGSMEEYEMTIRFCAGGVSTLYREWFNDKLSCSLEELNRMAEELIQRIIKET